MELVRGNKDFDFFNCKGFDKLGSCSLIIACLVLMESLLSYFSGCENSKTYLVG